jgi:hypothetical protein
MVASRGGEPKRQLEVGKQIDLPFLSDFIMGKYNMEKERASWRKRDGVGDVQMDGWMHRTNGLKRNWITIIRQHNGRMDMDMNGRVGGRGGMNE